MTAKIILVTGATDGIGLSTARILGEQGHDVLVHGRSDDKAARAVATLAAAAPHARFTPVSGDLSSKAAIAALAAQVRAARPRLDVLLNNAGVFMDRRELSVDGVELTYMVNHLAPMALTHALLPHLLAAGGGARVVTVSSIAHTRAPLDWDDLEGARRFDGYGAYALSKLGNVLFTQALARRHAPEALGCFSLHPGVISTKLLAKGFGMKGADVDAGAATSVHCATSPELEGRTGRYFSDLRDTPPSSAARNVENQERMFRLGVERLGLDWA